MNEPKTFAPLFLGLVNVVHFVQPTRGAGLYAYAPYAVIALHTAATAIRHGRGGVGQHLRRLTA
jgi:hypothetical protein